MTRHRASTPVAARGAAVALGLVLGIGASDPSWAARQEARRPAFAATLLMEAGNGDVLVATEPNRRWPPASMAKMMLMLLAAERLADGRLSLDDRVTASAWASRMGGSQVYLRQGESFPLREMMQAVVIASANDAAVAVAEHIAGTSDAFVDLMNQRAKELGLADTVYRTVHGLPPGRGQETDLTSARDLAVLAREVTRYPQVLAWASTPTAPFRGGSFTLTNTNRLVGTYRGATGLKTGYHRTSGFGLTATATRGDLTLVAVVLGAPTKAAAAEEAARLLTHGFSEYRVVEATTEGRTIGEPIPVEGGEVAAVHAVAAAGLRLVVKRTEVPKPQVEVRVPHLLSAPVEKGQRVGKLLVVNDGATLGKVDLLADREVAAVGWRSWLRAWWSGDEKGP
jgi:D-alanyl-D-alanine carboxypeptidase (penicillin-binding protein 5/6)